MSNPTDVQAVAERFLFTHNQAHYKEAFEEYLAPDCVIHEYLPGLPEPMNRAVYEGFIAGFRAALPDIHNRLEDLFIAGDRVAMRWTGHGTHTGADLMGIPAAGGVVQAHGIYILHIQDGKIHEVWNHWDNLNVLEQLRTGARPQPARVLGDASD